MGITFTIMELIGRINKRTAEKPQASIQQIKLPESGVAPDFLRAKEVLTARFPNGFRIESTIELSRFRRFAVKDFGVKVSLSDYELKKVINSCGMLFDGKVYIISDEVENKIKLLVDKAVNNDTTMIFYGLFYSKHEDWLFPASVISEKMLKSLLANMYPNYSYRAKYFSPYSEDGSELAKVGQEILRVWGEDVLLSYNQLAERLPYVPIDKIKLALAQNGDFIWNSTEVYTHISKIDVTDDERYVIFELVSKAYETNGYASLSDVPVTEIEERNFELSLTAIHNAVFRLCLTGTFNRNGKIITRKGDTLDALKIMKEYCRGLDRCLLQDLFNFEKELTGEIHRWISMEAGYSVMVRIDKDSYVAEKHVFFNYDTIDSVIDVFMTTGDYLPLKRFITFATFPYCGQIWNLFLLESYCRRFSKRFRFDTPSVNSRNAGAIIRKNCVLNYIEIMADAVAKSGIPLEKTGVCKFLYESGYTGRSTTSKAAEIIEKAKNIRTRRD